MIGSSLLLSLALAGQDAPPVPPVRAQTDLTDYFSPSWYPPEALRNREQGTVRFEATVGRDGRVEGCRIVASSGSRTLDEATCAIMSDRARFRAARDAQGERVADRFAAAVNWVLPPVDAAPVERARPSEQLGSYVTDGDYPPEALRLDQEGTVRFQLDISPEGRATYCHVLATSGSELLDLRTCQVMLERARFEPARDEAGNPVPDVHTARLTWRLGG